MKRAGLGRETLRRRAGRLAAGAVVKRAVTANVLAAAMVAALVVALVAALVAGPRSAHAAPATSFDGSVRLRVDPRQASEAGPLAEAGRLAAGIEAAPSSAALETEWRGRLGALSGAASLRGEADDGDGPDDDADGGHRRAEFVLGELYVEQELAGWSLTAGRRVVGWDVGYGFRPNDVVQQEPRRTLLPGLLRGRGVLQAERYGADSAWALVWVNPQRSFDDQPGWGGDEQALAVRGWRHLGEADLHLFARWGRHTRGSLGAALSWVPGDEWEWHGSLRWADGVDTLETDPAVAAGATLVTQDPVHPVTRRHVAQALVGLQWTGASRLGVMVEAWYDGAAPSDAEWRAWRARNAALPAVAASVPALAGAVAGQLAWQTGALGVANLRQTSTYARLSWERGAWQFTTDWLWMPADAGQVRTQTLAWQGDRLRLEAGWRRYGGPSDAIVRQLPARQLGYLAATWSF